MSAKVALVNPAFYDNDEFKNRFDRYLEWIKGGNLYVAPFEPPLGLAFLSAALREAGEAVEFLDMQGELMDTDTLKARLRASGAGLVGVTAMTPTLPQALRVAKVVREVLPAAKTVLGGVHPTLDPAGVLSDPNVDYVLRGEGERSLVQLARALDGEGALEDVEGLGWKIDGKPRFKERARAIADLDAIPLADYGAFPIERYVAHNAHLRGLRGISMVVSRGCPYQCTFCAVKETMGRKWRTTSVRRVVDQMIELRDRFGVEGIWFKDSIFNMRKDWISEFCEELVRRQVGLPWQALTRINLIDESQLAMMKEAGLVQLDLGIESGSPRVLARLKKGIGPEEIRKKVSLAKRYVSVFGFFMIGIPGEEESDIQQTFELAKELELDRWSWSIYSPLPGSTLYDELVADGKVRPFALDFNKIHFTEAYDGIGSVPAERLQELYREINEYFCAPALIA
ncbi:MAG: cobalamin-dependent protein [Polyangiaceae bacterium]